jgi:hypothetical protein
VWTGFGRVLLAQSFGTGLRGSGRESSCRYISLGSAKMIETVPSSHDQPFVD